MPPCFRLKAIYTTANNETEAGLSLRIAPLPRPSIAVLENPNQSRAHFSGPGPGLETGKGFGDIWLPFTEYAAVSQADAYPNFTLFSLTFQGRGRFVIGGLPRSTHLT